MGSLESTGESRIAPKVSEHSLIADFSLPAGADDRVKIRWDHMPFAHNHSTGGILPVLEIADGKGADRVGTTKGDMDHCRVTIPSAGNAKTFDDIKAAGESIDNTYAGMQKIFDKNIARFSPGQTDPGLSRSDVDKIAYDPSLTPQEKIAAGFLQYDFANIKNPEDGLVHSIDLKKWDISLASHFTIEAGRDAENRHYDQLLSDVRAGFDKAKVIGDNSLDSPWTDADKMNDAVENGSLSRSEKRGLYTMGGELSQFEAMDGRIYSKNFAQWRANKAMGTDLDAATALSDLDDCLKEYK